MKNKKRLIFIFLVVAFLLGTVSVYAASRCNSCGGTGYKTCLTCRGTGDVGYNNYRRCGTCGGGGIIYCRTCGGDGIYGN